MIKSYLRPLLSVCCLISSLILFGQTNSLRGTITLPKMATKMNQANLYNRDGSPTMHSKDPRGDLANNVIISLHPLDFKPNLKPTSNAIITQREQTFLPHVLPVTKGTTVYFLNEDEFFHNIYSLSPRARFNIGRRPPGNSYPIKVEKVGIIKLACDIHPHMSGQILSLDTPFFTRLAQDGSYKLTNLPDGNYRIQIFHPKTKKFNQTVRLEGGVVQEWNYNFSKP